MFGRIIPKGVNLLLRAHESTLPHIHRVSDLIQDHAWRRDFIHFHFHPLVAKEICFIPLPEQPTANLLIWGSNDDGVYSVKAGYNFTMHKRVSRVPSQSATVSYRDQFWKSIWCCPTLPRCCEFMCRVCHEIFPVTSSLVKKGMDINDFFVLCKMEPETTIHVLLRCPFANVVWFASPLGLRAE